MFFTFTVLVWLALCVAVGMFARIRRDRSGFGWFLAAFFFSPLLAFVFVAILDVKPSLVAISNETQGQTNFGFVGLAVILIVASAMAYGMIFA